MGFIEGLFSATKLKKAKTQFLHYEIAKLNEQLRQSGLESHSKDVQLKSMT